MTLLQNPIFLTQRRLVHREGVLAAILIAALIGLSLMSGLIASDSQMFGFSSHRQAGKAFYGWTVGVEALVLIFGSFSRIARALVEDRKAGLWDINRLTPLRPSQLVLGYWFGSALREVYMAVVLAFIGLHMVIIAGLPITLWLGTQLLLFAAALFFGLLAVLSGLAFQRTNIGVFMVAGLASIQLFSLTEPRLIITSYLLPIDGLIRLFLNSDFPNSISPWNRLPNLFGVTVEPILLSLVLQAVIGLFSWRAAIRKTAEPLAPLLRRADAIGIFAILTLVQQGLLWNLWRGDFGESLYERGVSFGGNGAGLSIAYCGILLLGLLMLGFSSPQPERIRVEALRSGTGNLRMVFSRSAVSLALALWAVAALSLGTHFLFSVKFAWVHFAIAVVNWIDCFLIFSLWLEFCRLEFRRRALGFVALGLFVVCILPLILGTVFDNAGFSKLSLLAPGVLALNDEVGLDTRFLLEIIVAQTAIMALLAAIWGRKWARLIRGTHLQN